MTFRDIIVDLFFERISIGTLNLPFSILDVLLKVLLPLLLVIMAYKLIIMALNRLLKLFKAKEKVRNSVTIWIRRILRISAFIAIIAFIGSLLGTEITNYLGKFINLINDPFFQTGNTKISIVSLLMLIPVFMAASWAGKYSKLILNRSVLNNFPIDEVRKFSIGNISRYIVMSIVFLFGLTVIGIDLSALSVLFGVLGLGLGFGLQGTVSNFFAGLTLISTGYVKENDLILVNGHEGKVVHIKMLSTIVSTLTHESLIIPNSQLMENTVHNYSFDDRKIVIINKISVSYNSDLDVVIQLMEQTAKRSPYHLNYPAPVARVDSFDDSGISMKLISWIDDISHKHEFSAWINLELWRTFKKENVEIPFPQMDIYLKNGELGEGKATVQEKTTPK